MKIRTKHGQVYKNFRLSYFNNWVIKKINYEDNILIMKTNQRLFWYNFEIVRRIIIRAVRKKIRMRYKKKKKVKIKIWRSYKRDQQYLKKLFWFSGITWVPLTMKPRGSRMGRGKGIFKIWFVDSKSGTILFKIRNCKIIILYVILKRISCCARMGKFMSVLNLAKIQYEHWYW